LTVERVGGRNVVARAADLRPDAIVATARAAAMAREAWEGAGRPGVLLYLSDDPDPVAVRLDLRLWGGERVALVEEGAAGLAPRADLFPPATASP
jgi:hypothetical protein